MWLRVTRWPAETEKQEVRGARVDAPRVTSLAAAQTHSWWSAVPGSAGHTHLCSAAGSGLQSGGWPAPPTSCPPPGRNGSGSSDAGTPGEIQPITQLTIFDLLLLIYSSCRSSVSHMSSYLSDLLQFVLNLLLRSQRLSLNWRTEMETFLYKLQD